MSRAPTGSTLGERLNNAIVQLDWVFPTADDGRKRAVAELARQWVAWWDSSARKLLPPVALHDKLTRFAQWYARAWLLADEKTQAKTVDPRSLDTSVLSMVDDQIAYIMEGQQAAVESAKVLRTELESELGKLHKIVKDDLMLVVGLGVVGLLAFGWMEGKRHGGR